MDKILFDFSVFLAPQEDVNKPPNPQAPAQPPAVAQAEANQDQKQLSDGEAANKVMEQTENELYNKVKNHAYN